jgi:tRNA(His) 5'-end guanylyltransferase
MTTKDELGDRMKVYESQETGRRFLPLLPVYARIDGRGFSKFTRGMDRPFDQRMTDAMVEVTNHLVKETHAAIGYVQSDEISLIWNSDNYDSSIFFDGKIAKMTSVLASMASAKMAQAVRGWKPYEDRLPAFDARVIQLPNKTEAVNMLLWRTMDATKNAVSMAAHAEFGHKQLQGKGQATMIGMLNDAGQPFDDLPPAFRFGTFAQRQVTTRSMSPEELAKIPAKHRPAPGERVTRTEIVNWSHSFRHVSHNMKLLTVFGMCDPSVPGMPFAA